MRDQHIVRNYSLTEASTPLKLVLEGVPFQFKTSPHDTILIAFCSRKTENSVSKEIFPNMERIESKAAEEEKTRPGVDLSTKGW